MAVIMQAAEGGALSPKMSPTVSLMDAISGLTDLEVKGAPKGKLVIVTDCAFSDGLAI